MKHLIVGCGVVGDATGFMLKYLNEDVFYYDIDTIKLKNRRRLSITSPNIDIVWICTAEWDIDKALQTCVGTDKLVVIRSTLQPGQTMGFGQKYHIASIAHCPEFLRAASARIDAITPDRIVIGAILPSVYEKLKFLEKLGFVYYTYPNVSEMIKLVANAYLSNQVSFWNEMRIICRSHLLEPEPIINVVKKDKRIGKYGTYNKGAFKGFCLPKDLDQLIKTAERSGCNPRLLKAIKEVNEYIKVIR